MERTIDSAVKHPDPRPAQRKVKREGKTMSRKSPAVVGRIDMRSVAIAIPGGLAYLALASLGLELSRFNGALASIWFPNAMAVALLLLARLRSELPIYAAFALACFAANLLVGTSEPVAANFTLANLVGIAAIMWLVRRSSGSLPDFTDVGELGRFLVYGGIVGPLASTVVAAPALLPQDMPVWSGIAAWFLAESMGMILLVPAALFIAEAARRRTFAPRADLTESTLLIGGGLVAIYLVFRQDVYPLLFLAPPVTLLVAFRLGALGTAIFVPALAALAIWQTYIGFGPIMNNSTSDLSQTYLIQGFVAVNFLTGLPIAAILAGRERMTEELAKGKREVALLTENITDAVLKLDPEGVCTYASPSVSEVLGRDPEEFVGFPVTHRTHEDAHERIREVLDRLLGGVSVKERLTYRRLIDDADGNPVFIEADCAVVTNPSTGRADGIVVSARDVTERVELELLLTRSRAKAENAARAKSEFLANMSHEIRTPMNGVLGFAELMLQGDLSAEARRHTEMILRSGRSMMLLLNDILDLSKIEAGQIAISREPVDLSAAIAECVALHRPTAEGKGLKLNFEGATGTGSGHREMDGFIQRPWVLTDGLRLRQIILNLVGNAVKFTQNGSVDIRYVADAERISIEISDTGIGISANRLKTIFAPFTQGENDTARRFGGTGLGLTISQQLAGLLGGTIEAESKPGAGSTFRVRLPAHYAEPALPAPAEQQPVEPAELPQRARVLLVEDHDVNRMLGMEMLERCGQDVAIAHDGNEAITMVIDSVMRGAPFDLVLMDIQMPGCDGYAATRAIRADGIGPDLIPIVALTANAFPEDVAAARAAGMQAHLAKPLVFAELARALQRWLPTRIVESERRAPRDRRSGDRRSTITIDTRDRTHEIVESAPAPSPETVARRQSPALMSRWSERRREAVEAVRSALEQGRLAEQSSDRHDHLAHLLHKLAGTAAIFGEEELGEQAAVFERALRERSQPERLEAMAARLLSLADAWQQRELKTGT